jgi:hypothetical protein
MDDLVERLIAEECRMVRLWEVCANMHDKHRGTPAAFDFNSLKHAVSGRDTVLTDAVTRITALEAEVARLTSERDGARLAALKDAFRPITSGEIDVDGYLTDEEDDEVLYAEVFEETSSGNYKTLKGMIGYEKSVRIFNAILSARKRALADTTKETL